jgi:hypothetical protein
MLIGAMRLTQTFVTCMYVCCVVVATDATLQAPGVPKYMFSAAQEEKGQVLFRMHACRHTALLLSCHVHSSICILVHKLLSFLCCDCTH